VGKLPSAVREPSRAIICDLLAEKLTGAKFTYVPFTGTAPQVTAFLGGHIDAIMGTSDDLTIHKDKVRVFAFATDKRFPGTRCSHFQGIEDRSGGSS